MFTHITQQLYTKSFHVKLFQVMFDYGINTDSVCELTGEKNPFLGIA